MAYTIYIAYTADPFPQTPRPGENAGKEDVPKDGDAIFSIQSDDPVLTNGNRGDDIEQFYEVVEGPALRALSAAEVEAVQLPGAQSAANTAIDNKAGEVRGHYLTNVTGQEGTYLEKRNDAETFKGAGYPEASIDSYPWVKAKAAALGDTTGQVAADTILATAGQWTGVVGPAIEEQRENGKRLVSEANDVAGVETARDNALAALEALKP